MKSVFSTSSLTSPAVCVLCAILLCLPAQAGAATVLKNLAVEYQSQPLGMDVVHPRFSWQMDTTTGQRGIVQTAYRIQVEDPSGSMVWDTNKVEDATAVGISYGGTPLNTTTRYTWTVTVWDKTGAKVSSHSWFETGLMDSSPDASAWGGAQWIGGGNRDLVLYSPYLALFDVKYNMTIAPGSTHASFVYGANDSRLMDRNKNIFQVQSAKDQSYIKLELDISAVDGTPGRTAKLNVYRAGYNSTDNPAKPFHVFAIPTSIINQDNKNAAHTIAFSSAFGQIAITIDGQSSISAVGAAADDAQGFGGPPGMPRPTNTVNLNPVGQGGNFIAFGMLCDMGFSVDPGQSASIGDLTVSNNRRPNNILFRENLNDGDYRGIYAGFIKPDSGLSIADGNYMLSGGSNGIFVVSNPSHNSMPMLRTTFNISGKAVDHARLYITARGIYEAYLNGKRIGDDYYNPGLTQYNVTQMYQTYDVTSMLKPQGNTLGAMLGEGWWSGLLSFGDIWNHFGDRQSLRAELVITYKDGSSDTIVTSPQTWKYYGNGPVVYSSLDFGEIYDAGREPAIDGWTTAAYNDSQWKDAVEVPLQGTTFSGSEQVFGPGGPRMSPPFTFDKLKLIGQIGDSAGIFKILTAQSVQQVRPGVFVYNMGQNMVGVPRITLSAGHPGKTITLRYAEMLYPNLPVYGKNVGMILTENYRAAISQDEYTEKAGSQVIQPRFTFRGYQYIEITGIDQALPLASVQGVVISSLHHLTADYKTSNPKVNRLWSNLVWSNVNNFVTIPTDCPQRNERMGWSGDINVFSHTATYVSNADQFLTRHMYAMRDVQSDQGRFTDVAPVGGGFGGILWGSAGIVIPWQVYQQYGDVALLAQNYPAMAAYMSYIDTTINPKTGFTSEAILGDWLGPQNGMQGTDFLATAYHAYDLGIMAKVAAILGKSSDAETYTTQYEDRKAFFNRTFVNAEKVTLATVSGMGAFGGGRRRARNTPGGPEAPAAPEFKVNDTQTSYAVPLAMGLFSAENEPYMVKNLAAAVDRENKDDSGALRPKDSLMTGFIGTAFISKALSDSGRSDLAYRLLENQQYPSWLYSIDQGATSIWERLNGYTVDDGFGGNNSMNSFDHYSFGAVGQWMMAYSLGIQRDEPGFKKFILQPEPDTTGGITSAEGYYDSMYGCIKSAWKLNGRTLAYSATVPANSTAILYLPASGPGVVTEGGNDAAKAAGITFLRFENGKAVYQLQSGAYAFTSQL